MPRRRRRAIAVEADRQEALDWLLQRAALIADESFATFMKEIAGPKRKHSRRTLGSKLKRGNLVR